MAVTNYITGYDHIGIPTNDMDKTIKFYTSLGFVVEYETKNDGSRVVFISCGDVMFETYEMDGQTAGKRGAIDHIALRVNDVDKVTEKLKKDNFSIVDGPFNLPFWDNGVKYVCIEGPNGEIIEFIQKY